jgi:hypothetical protein
MCDLEQPVIELLGNLRVGFQEMEAITDQADLSGCQVHAFLRPGVCSGLIPAPY